MTVAGGTREERPCEGRKISFDGARLGRSRGLFRTVVIVIASFSAGRNFGFERSTSSSSLRQHSPSSISGSIPTDDHGNPRNRPEANGTVCFKWSEGLEADRWWEYNPDFEPLDDESDEGACFARIQSVDKRSFTKNLHTLQYNVSRCHEVVTRHMWSTGWGSDFNNVAGGLLRGVNSKKPFQVSFVDEGYAWQDGW